MIKTSHGFLEFECDCKAKRGFEFVAPTVGTPTLKGVKCEGCGSEWEIRIRLVILQGIPRMTYTHRLTRGSGKLADIIKKKKIDEILGRPQKKSPIFVVPDMGGIKR